MKFVFNVLAFVFLGIIGGVFANQFIIPYFMGKGIFYDYSVANPSYFYPKEKKVIITENEALPEIFESIEKSVVGVRAVSKGKIIEGSGIVITSDGLIITTSSLLPRGGDFVFYVDDKAPSSWQILKRDIENNLALVKLEENNLSPVSLAEFGSLRFGQRVFSVSVLLKGEIKKSLNQGIIKFYNSDLIETNIIEKAHNLDGCPLFNIKGELVGMALTGSTGEISAVPVNKIKEFAGF